MIRITARIAPMAAPTMSRVLVRRAGMFHTNAGPAIAPNTTTAKNRPLSRAYAISTVSASRSFWLRRPSLAVMEALSHGSRGLRTSVGPPHAAVFAVPAGAFHRVIVSVPGQAVVRVSKSGTRPPARRTWCRVYRWMSPWDFWEKSDEPGGCAVPLPESACFATSYSSGGDGECVEVA